MFIMSGNSSTFSVFSFLFVVAVFSEAARSVIIDEGASAAAYRTVPYRPEEKKHFNNFLDA